MKPDTASLDYVETADPELGADPLEEVARQVANGVAKTEIAALVDSIRKTKQRPREIDARLLAMSGRALGNDLDPSQKSKVREAFLNALEARLHEAPDAR